MYYSREIDEKETIPYPICSVVASWIGYCFFFCVLAPEEMNAMVYSFYFRLFPNELNSKNISCFVV